MTSKRTNFKDSNNLFFCLAHQQWWKMKEGKKRGIMVGYYRYRVCKSKPSASLSSSQWLERKRNKFINIFFIFWVEQCWQHCLQLSGFPAFALNQNKTWQSQYVFCPVLSHTTFTKKVVWQKFAWNLGCLRSASFPWGNLMDKGGQPQQKLTALQLPALQVWIHISYGWIKILLKHRLNQ